MAKSLSLNFISALLLSIGSQASQLEYLENTRLNSDGTCTALVLSGGATEGAWEAGILWGLMNYGDPSNFEYDVISGISAGAINAAGLAGF